MKACIVKRSEQLKHVISLESILQFYGLSLDGHYLSYMKLQRKSCDLTPLQICANNLK